VESIQQFRAIDEILPGFPRYRIDQGRMEMVASRLLERSPGHASADLVCFPVSPNGATFQGTPFLGATFATEREHGDADPAQG